jgi:aminomethyltransferase
METIFLNEYETVREKGAGFFEQKRGLIEVSGKEAEMFLNGLITNDVKKLSENSWMRAAFPNAQGRLLAVIKVWRNESKFYFDTESATHETVLRNLKRFTLAGDFFVKDLTEEFICYSVQGKKIPDLKFQTPNSENQILEAKFNGKKITILKDENIGKNGFYFYVPENQAENFKMEIQDSDVIKISQETFEVLRIEAGLPLYGVDMDETTVVLETGLDDAVNFNKGCYIGQEIIARIHFRGHVAKKLTGLILEDTMSKPSTIADGFSLNVELKSLDGKNAGRITSKTFSPKLKKTIALAYVRYDYLAQGTQLKVNELTARVKDLPFIE